MTIVLSPGKHFKVVGFEKQCDETYRLHLMAMGLIPGTIFEVLRVAPLGDPIEIEVKGFLLSLRVKESQMIQLETVDE